MHILIVNDRHTAGFVLMHIICISGSELKPVTLFLLKKRFFLNELAMSEVRTGTVHERFLVEPIFAHAVIAFADNYRIL